MGVADGPLSGVDTHQLLIAVAVGAVVGLASGAFGKGGSALATPLLAAFGIPPIIAVASPLPATIPATAIAGRAYARAGMFDWRVIRIGIVVGLPLTAAGALLTRWVPGEPLVLGSELLVLALAVRMLVRPQSAMVSDTEPMPEAPRTRVVATVAAVAFVSGLLANSGGFLLAPLFVAVLQMPLKRALGTSLGISLALAIPGTIVHAALGHIHWPLTLAFGVASVPFARLGAHLSMRANARGLARTYGIALALAATFALVATH
jgi:uncharacterized membrane protein YfcA